MSICNTQVKLTIIYLQGHDTIVDRAMTSYVLKHFSYDMN